MKVFSAFFYLSAFSGFGGIEKFNKALIRALSDTKEINCSFFSVYDTGYDKKYLSSGKFKTANGSKLIFVILSFFNAFKSDILFLGHINLSITAVLVKLFSPKTKIVVITHGIDVWSDLSFMKKRALKTADKIIAVSNFTKQKIINKHKIPKDKIIVFPNTIDPYFPQIKTFEKPQYLLKRYQINPNRPIILTVARLSAQEGYKGYDKVLDALPKITDRFPDVLYLIVGKYDKQEKHRLDKIINNLNIKNHVFFTGFVDEKELTDYFKLGDVFIMPSKNEGFGIVFIEALACGLPVIAGNVDGSIDALDNGNFGKLINPDNIDAISSALIGELERNIAENDTAKFNRQKTVFEKFGFSQYKKNLQSLLNNL